MDTQQLLQTAEELLKEWTIEVTRPEADRVDIYIDGSNIKAAVKALFLDGHWGYLSAITGMDVPEYEVDPQTNEKKANPEKGTLELLYHFCNQAAVATLRVRLPYSKAEIDSICDLISSAALFEREAMEMLGITIKDTPLTSNLILPDDWPAGVYPLRKAFTGFEKHAEG